MLYCPLLCQNSNKNRCLTTFCAVWIRRNIRLFVSINKVCTTVMINKSILFSDAVWHFVFVENLRSGGKELKKEGGEERIVDWQRTKTGCARWGLRGKEGWWEEECPSYKRLSLPAAPCQLQVSLHCSVQRKAFTPVPVVELWGVHSLPHPFGVWCSMALKHLKSCVLCFSEMNVV